MTGHSLLAVLAGCALLLGAGASGPAWTWSPVRAGGIAPSARQGHASVEVGRRIYVIGGCSQDVLCHNDVHVFDTDRQQWSQEVIAGEAPEPRSGHTASLVSANVFVFGGANSQETFADVHCLDLVKRRWVRASLASGDASVPERRTGHAAAVDAHGRVYVFGGYGMGARFFNDIWILKVSGASLSGSLRDSGVQSVRWVRQAPTGQLPTPREGHTLTLVDRKLVLFGGYASCGKVLNDLHLYDLDAQHWTKLEPGGALPLPRQAHSAVRHGRDVVIAGGCDSGDTQPRCFHDVWALNVIDLQWTQKSSGDANWNAREGHTATFVRGRMFAFGGCQLGTRCYGDVAVLDSSEPCPAACGGHGDCVNAEFCRCTAPGFTGHDCMQPLTCQTDCSGHGACSQNGRCVCENGWTGADCSVEIPCPGGATKCSSRGVCLLSGSCQCFPGFTGADCAIAASARCPAACSGHGRCGPNGKCTCRSGWAGEACNRRTAVTVGLQLKCPEGCCGHGVCSRGTCVCHRGWHGDACSLNSTAWTAATERLRMRLLAQAHAQRRHAQIAAASLAQVRSLLAQADADEQRAAGDLTPEPQDLALISASGGVCAGPERVTREDFGVKGLGADPRLAGEKKCQDDCNFRGLCDQGTCYCQPGYYGPACDTMKKSERDTLSLKDVLIISGACLLVVFVGVLTGLCMKQQASRSGEREQGYHVKGIA